MTRHFSLIAYVDGFDFMMNRYHFVNKVKDAIDLFVFRHKAIFTVDKLHQYNSSWIKEEVKKNLVNLTEK